MTYIILRVHILWIQQKSKKSVKMNLPMYFGT